MSLDVLSIYASEIKKYPLISRAEEVELAKKIKLGCTESLEKLITANLRLVVRIASGYKNCNLDIMDIISEGNIGLTKAAQSYDPSKGASFCTYASYHIKKSMSALNATSSRLIKLPTFAHYAQIQIKKSKESGTPLPDSIKKSLVKNLSFLCDTLVSLHETTENGHCLQDSIKDETCTQDFEVFEYIKKNFMPKLPERYQYVLKSRMGIDCERLTLEEVGEKMGITRERARQIEIAAIKKLSAMCKEHNIRY